MIKKHIKPLNFITLKYTLEYDENDWFNPVFRSPGIYTREFDTVTLGGLDLGEVTINANAYPNYWQVNLGGQERLVLDGDGDMRITGRMHALGSVMWNQETGTLQFWDGNIWQNINFNLPPN